MSVAGTIDERYRGFGELPTVSVLVIDVSGIAFITSFGVRKWIEGMKKIPASVGDIYIVGCPPIFVEQLNMILNFGGRAQVLSLQAPYLCTKCSNETVEMIDVVGDQQAVADRVGPEKVCLKCGAKTELDETGELYFAFLGKYGPTKHINPAATQILTMDTRKQRKRIEQPPPAALGSVAVADGSSGIAKWVIGAVVLLAAITAVVYALMGPL